MDNGCKLGWLIDPENEVVYVYFNGVESTHEGFDQPFSGRTSFARICINIIRIETAKIALTYIPRAQQSLAS